MIALFAQIAQVSEFAQPARTAQFGWSAQSGKPSGMGVVRA